MRAAAGSAHVGRNNLTGHVPESLSERFPDDLQVWKCRLQASIAHGSLLDALEVMETWEIHEIEVPETDGGSRVWTIDDVRLAAQYRLGDVVVPSPR